MMLINATQVLRTGTLVALVATLSSCGVGKKMVRDLHFVTEKTNDVYYTGFDAKIDLQGLSLPPAELPIRAPKDPSVTLGTLRLDAANNLSVRVDLAQATKVSVLDGSLLPNGRVIPMTLEGGAFPIAFPVGGSHTKIYLALGQGTIMAGVAVTLDPNIGGKVGDLLKTSMNLFFPFTIDPTVRGTVGMFSGDEFGLGVFAVKSTSPSESAVIANATGIVHTMSADGIADKIEPQEVMPSQRKTLQFYDAVRKIRRLELK